MAHILAVTSQVAYGHVGARAFAAAAEPAGHRVSAIPTVVLAHHAGLPGGPRGLTLDVTNLRKLGAGLQDLNLWPGLDALYTGYFREQSQVEWAGALLRALHTAGDALFACDPILGDRGKGLYVPKGVAESIAANLVPQADILTPNLFELEYLTGRKIANAAETVEAARSLRCAEVVVTSVPAGQERIGAIAVRAGQCVFAHAPRLDTPAPGAGDLFAGAYLGKRLAGRPIGEAVSFAVAALHAILAASLRAGSQECLPGAAPEALTAPDADALRVERL